MAMPGVRRIVALVVAVFLLSGGCSSSVGGSGVVCDPGRLREQAAGGS